MLSVHFFLLEVVEHLVLRMMIEIYDVYESMKSVVLFFMYCI